MDAEEGGRFRQAAQPLREDAGFEGEVVLCLEGWYRINAGLVPFGSELFGEAVEPLVALERGLRRAGHHSLFHSCLNLLHVADAYNLLTRPAVFEQI